MQTKKTQLALYYNLLGKSYFRLFMEFPLLLRLLFVLFFGGGVYLLVNLPFTASLRNYAIVFVVFFLLGQWLCRMTSQERILLTFLKIPVVSIRVVKCLILAAFFFLLDVGAGLLVMTLGTLAVAFYSGGTVRNIKIRSFYVPSSYQWLGMYRRSGIWVLLAGFMLFLIGLWHENENMVCFFLGWIICIPCLFAYYGQPDPKQFMSVYKNKSVLMRRKVLELLINLSIPVAVCTLLLLLFDLGNIGFYGKYILLFLYADLLLFYFSYICYPHILTAFALSGISIFILTGFFIIVPILTVLFGLIFLYILHTMAVIYLIARAPYEKPESTH